ncbi:MAG: carbohydrate kinase [Gemmatimonadetes bacterium]|jgi:xylulokinase|nr:carbohydrate kinase [Gemmatimonadota bacterium]MBT5145265.1 carbohydrate kinase [Gemmatimonadota bacterium]MBT5965297.1 carbohydrate kinase [Gemmatimonadota bacterium]MBT7454116.1 carbohydrate kinase [Gemmatimonadota bacterium]
MGNFLGIDASTQSMTGLVINTSSAQIIAEESVNFDEYYAEKYGVENGVLDAGNGVVHSPPLMWAEALEALLRQLRESGINLASIEAVSGSGQQHGTVYLNQSAAGVLGGLRSDLSLTDQLNGVFSRPTAPVWMDTSTRVQCDEIETGVGGRQRLLELTGNTAFERFSGPQIRKFAQQEPAAYERTTTICLVSSFVASLLAGRVVPVDAGDGSGTNLMDIGQQRWSQDALAATAPDLGQRLLPIIKADSIVGSISPYWVDRYGFNPTCNVLPFSGDNPCSLIGLGLVEPGKLALSLGTSDTFFACMDKVRISSTGEGALFASPDGVHYMALICFLNGSLAREAVRDQYNLDWEGFAAGLRQTNPGNDEGLMLPYFDAEIVPHVATPGVIRQNLDPHNAAANVRAVIEAQALSSRIHAEWMGVNVQSISVTGGASANAEILQVFADVHDCEVQQFQTTNAAALGAALRASHGHMTALGTPVTWPQTVSDFSRPLPGSDIQPRAQTVTLYDERLEAYRDLEARHT